MCLFAKVFRVYVGVEILLGGRSVSPILSILPRSRGPSALQAEVPAVSAREKEPTSYSHIPQLTMWIALCWCINSQQRMQVLVFSVVAGVPWEANLTPKLTWWTLMIEQVESRERGWGHSRHLPQGALCLSQPQECTCYGPWCVSTREGVILPGEGQR